MRKLITLTLVLTMIMCVFSITSVFADNTPFDFGEPIKVDDATYKVPIVLNCVGTTGYDDYLDNISIKINAVNCTLSTGTISSGVTADWAFDNNEAGNYVLKVANSDGYVNVTNNGYEIFIINVTKTDSNATLNFGTCLVSETESEYRLEASSSNTKILELWKATSPEVTGTSTTAQGTTFGNYKDVPLFKYEATVSNATESTKFYMTPELFLNGTSAGTKAKTLIPGLTVDGEGKIVVNIAIVGAPEGTVTINPNITAE